MLKLCICCQKWCHPPDIWVHPRYRTSNGNCLTFPLLRLSLFIWNKAKSQWELVTHISLRSRIIAESGKIRTPCHVFVRDAFLLHASLATNRLRKSVESWPGRVDKRHSAAESSVWRTHQHRVVSPLTCLQVCQLFDGSTAPNSSVTEAS